MRSVRVDRRTHQAACPRCGTSSFVPKRTKKGLLMLGIFAPKKLQCAGCGKRLKHG